MKKVLLISLFLLLPSFAFSATWSLKESGTASSGWGAIAFYKYTGEMYFCTSSNPTSPWQASGAWGAYAVARDYCESGNHGQLSSSTQPGAWYYLDITGTTFRLWESWDYLPDADGDGVADGIDECPDTPPPAVVDSVGCLAQPSFCTDTVVSGDELGIDCGGSCIASCVWRCPDDFGLIDSVCSYTGPFINCGDSLDCPVLQADGTGSCPDNYQFDSGICFQVVGKILASEDVVAPYVSPGDVSFISSSLSSDTGLDSTTVYNTAVDPATGNITTTSTTTNDNTYIDSSGTPVTSGESTVVRVLVESPTGEVLSDTSTSTSSFATPNIYSEPYDSSFASADFGTRFEVFTANLENAPIYVPLKTIFSPDLSGGLSTYSLSMGSYGSVEFDFSDYADAWAVLRICLIFLAVFFSAKLIIANK